MALPKEKLANTHSSMRFQDFFLWDLDGHCLLWLHLIRICESDWIYWMEAKRVGTSYHIHQATLPLAMLWHDSLHLQTKTPVASPGNVAMTWSATPWTWHHQKCEQQTLQILSIYTMCMYKWVCSMFVFVYESIANVMTDNIGNNIAIHRLN